MLSTATLDPTNGCISFRQYVCSKDLATMLNRIISQAASGNIVLSFGSGSMRLCNLPNLDFSISHPE